MLPLKNGSVMSESLYKDFKRKFEKISDENEPSKIIALYGLEFGKGNILRIEVSYTF